jgi:catechol 2,3-dioxygenase-like lactoylglutathione lyase family enzyme
MLSASKKSPLIPETAADRSDAAAILETALYASDIDAAERFYGGVLGLPKVARVGDRHVFFRLGGSMLLIFNPAETGKPPHDNALPVPPHGARGPGHVAFAAGADELDRWRARLEAAGVAIEADFRWPTAKDAPAGIAGARSIYVRDPAGNSIEFAEPRLWGFS